MSNEIQAFANISLIQLGSGELKVLITSHPDRNHLEAMAAAIVKLLNEAARSDFDIELFIDATRMLKALSDCMIHLEAVERMHDSELPEVEAVRELLTKHGAR